MESPSALVVRASSLHGRGCFAARILPSGSIVAEYVGERIDRAEAVRRDDRTSPSYSPYVLEVSADIYLDGAIGGNASRYLNHSCHPNSRVWRTGMRAFIVAARRIEVGEELCIDYGVPEDVPLLCTCDRAPALEAPCEVSRAMG